jgi:hypothetical protein
MSTSNKFDERIQQLKVRRIEIQAQLTNPVVDDFFSYMSGGAQKLRQELGRIDIEITLLQKEKQAAESASVGRTKKATRTKQETRYEAINRMKKRSPKATMEDLFDKLAERTPGSTPEAIKKSYYAQASKEMAERQAKAKEKRGSDTNSDQQNQGEQKLPK